jgi:4-oxalocrotonate tautomerase
VSDSRNRLGGQEETVPMTQIYLHSGKPISYRRAIADSIQKALTDAIGVPAEERFQIITEVDSESFVFDPNFQNVARSQDFMIILITLKSGRSNSLKQSLYQAIVREMAIDPGVRSEDVMIVLRENGSADWSFGNGMAQLLS